MNNETVGYVGPVEILMQEWYFQCGVLFGWLVKNDENETLKLLNWSERINVYVGEVGEPLEGSFKTSVVGPNQGLLKH